MSRTGRAALRRRDSRGFKDARRVRRWAQAAVGVAGPALALGLMAAPAATADGAAHASAFPPKTNSAWVYDTSTPGTWVDAIKDYNSTAQPGRELNEVYTYANDLEMYC